MGRGRQKGQTKIVSKITRKQLKNKLCQNNLF